MCLKSSHLSGLGRCSTLTFASVQISPKLHISLHSDHHFVLWWSKRQWWVTFPPFFSHPSVRPLHNDTFDQISFHTLKSYTYAWYMLKVNIRINNVWFSTMQHYHFWYQNLTFNMDQAWIWTSLSIQGWQGYQH